MQQMNSAQEQLLLAQKAYHDAYLRQRGHLFLENVKDGHSSAGFSAGGGSSGFGAGAGGGDGGGCHRCIVTPPKDKRVLLLCS